MTGMVSFAFDLLDRAERQTLPLEERKARLADLLTPVAGGIVLSEHIEAMPASLAARASSPSNAPRTTARARPRHGSREEPGQPGDDAGVGAVTMRRYQVPPSPPHCSGEPNRARSADPSRRPTPPRSATCPPSPAPAPTSDAPHWRPPPAPPSAATAPPSNPSGSPQPPPSLASPESKTQENHAARRYKTHPSQSQTHLRQRDLLSF